MKYLDFKMRHCLVLACMIFVLLSSASCEKKEYGYSPTYSGIQFSPAQPVAGDSVTATVKVADFGAGAYPTKVKWTVDGVSETLTDIAGADYEYVPTYSFVATAGTMNVSCSVTFSMHYPTESGQLYGSASTSGSVKVSRQ